MKKQSQLTAQLRKYLKPHEKTFQGYYKLLHTYTKIKLTMSQMFAQFPTIDYSFWKQIYKILFNTTREARMLALQYNT